MRKGTHPSCIADDAGSVHLGDDVAVFQGVLEVLQAPFLLRNSSFLSRKKRGVILLRFWEEIICSTRSSSGKTGESWHPETQVC